MSGCRMMGVGRGTKRKRVRRGKSSHLKGRWGKGRWRKEGQRERRVERGKDRD